MPKRTLPLKPIVTQRGGFGGYLQGLRERLHKDKREMGKDLGLGANTIGLWESEANPGLRLSYLILLADYFTGQGLPWDWNEVMAYFGAPPPQGVDLVASELASRPALRDHFDVIRRWDDRQLRTLTASLKGIPLATGRQKA